MLDLDTTFLHDGRPTRSMTAIAPTPGAGLERAATSTTPACTLLELLAHPNIASKAAIVHRYDHEIGGATLVRPLTGADDVGHADGVVMAHPEDDYGFAVGIGVNPWYGLHDPKAMAEVAIDEAIRNVVAVGADPDLVSLLDNFSWGDPRDPETLGELAAAVDGCCTAAMAFGAPFVSGKDSLNNTYVGRDGQRHAVPPTLVITAVAHVPDADACVTPELRRRRQRPAAARRRPGVHFAGSHLDLLTGAHRTASPEAGHGAAVRPRLARPLPRAAPGDPPAASSSRATTSARAASPWRSPRCASHRGSAPPSTRCRTTTSRPRCSPSRPGGSSSRSPSPTSTRWSAWSAVANGSASSPTSRCSTSRASTTIDVDRLRAAFHRGSDW